MQYDSISIAFLGIEVEATILPTSMYSWLSLRSSELDGNSVSWSAKHIFKLSCIKMFEKYSCILSISDTQYWSSSKHRSDTSRISIRRRSATGMQSTAWSAYVWSEFQNGELMSNTFSIVDTIRSATLLLCVVYSDRRFLAFDMHADISFDTLWACFWPPEKYDAS